MFKNSKSIYALCVLSLILNIVLFFGVVYLDNKIQRNTENIVESDINSDAIDKKVETAPKNENKEVDIWNEFSILKLEDGLKRCDFPGIYAISVELDSSWDCYSQVYNEVDEKEYKGGYIENSVRNIVMDISTNQISNYGGCQINNVDTDCEEKIVYPRYGYDIVEVKRKSQDNKQSISYEILLPSENLVKITKLDNSQLSDEDITSVVEVIEVLKSIGRKTNIDNHFSKNINVNDNNKNDFLYGYEEIRDIDGITKCNAYYPMNISVKVGGSWKCTFSQGENQFIGAMNLKNENKNYQIHFLNGVGGYGICWGVDNCEDSVLYNGDNFEFTETKFSNLSDDFNGYEYYLKLKNGNGYSTTLIHVEQEENYRKLTQQEVGEIIELGKNMENIVNNN